MPVALPRRPVAFERDGALAVEVGAVRVGVYQLADRQTVSLLGRGDLGMDHRVSCSGCLSRRKPYARCA